jgi:drug/metabolite transporter (DMT)-like permease
LWGRPGLALPLLLAEIGVFSATFSLIFILQAIAGPVHLGQIGSVGAVAGAALAALLLGEAIDTRIAVAAAAILAGVFLVSRRG